MGIKAENPWIGQEEAELLSQLSHALRLGLFSIDVRLVTSLTTNSWPEQLFAYRPEDGSDFIAWMSAIVPLSPGDQTTLRFQLANSFGMGNLQWKVCEAALPLDFSSRDQDLYSLQIKYLPKFTHGKLQKISIVVLDQSELKNKERQIAKQKRQVNKFQSLVNVSDSLFDLFFTETKNLLGGVQSNFAQLRKSDSDNTEDPIVCILRTVHTIKANSKLFRLESIQDLTDQIEVFIEESRTKEMHFSHKTLSVLEEKFSLLSREVHSYAHLRHKLKENGRDESNIEIKYRVQWVRSLMNQFASVLREPNFEQRDVGLIQKEFSRALMSFEKTSLRDYIRGYNQMVRDIASQTKKEVKDLEVDLEFYHFDAIMLARVNDIIVHCLRNAIDHGIEHPEERMRSGKSREGTIALKTCEEKGVAYIEISDDGHGIDVKQIKSKALEIGLLHGDQLGQVTDSELIPLLFHPGLSTAAKITDISGRGVGMDAMRDYVQGLNGQIFLSFEQGKGTKVSIYLPLAEQDFLAPLAIHDMRDIFRDALSAFPNIQDSILKLLADHQEPQIIFADRLIWISIFRDVFALIFDRLLPEQSIHATVVEHKGRRRVDSFNFFRIKLSLSGEDIDQEIHPEQNARLEVIAHMVRRAGGSLFFHRPYCFEINVPSQIPVKFAEYEFKVLNLMDDSEELPARIENFFAGVMGGWKHKIFHQPLTPNSLEEIRGTACLVLLDSKLIETYLQARGEADRMHDGVVLFPRDELDVDVLKDSSILPENLLFIPPSFDERHLHLCLAGVIFRRFLREMVRTSEEIHRYGTDQTLEETA